MKAWQIFVRRNGLCGRQRKNAQVLSQGRWTWDRGNHAGRLPQTSDLMSTKTRCTRNKVNNTFQMVEHLQVSTSCLLFEVFPQVVNIYFNAGSFDKVTRSAKTNFVSQLSLIGGTFGLFTGFSILSGIEIVYFLIKVDFHYHFISSQRFHKPRQFNKISATDVVAKKLISTVNWSIPHPIGRSNPIHPYTSFQRCVLFHRWWQQ